MRKIDAADRSTLIRLARTLSKGFKERRAILAGLKKARSKEVTLVSDRGSVSIHIDNRPVSLVDFRDVGDELGAAVDGDDIPWEVWEKPRKI